MMPMRRAILLGLVVAAGAGCGRLESADDRVMPDKPLWFHRPSGAMKVVFRRELTAASRTVGEDYERGRAGIDASRRRVFVGTADHGLYALRAGDGSTIWRFETLGVVQSEPLYDGALDVVYFGSHDGALYAVNASDGTLVFRFDTGAEVARKPAVDSETLFVANGADNLFAIDRRTGKQRWHVHRTPALGMEVSGYAGPTYDHGLVFMAYSDGHVVAYDARDGSERWTPVDLSAEAEQSAGAEGLRYLDVDTTPVVDDLGPQGRVVYVASYAGGVFALDQEKGVPVWKNERAVGVTDLVLWQERAHDSEPERKQLLASSAVSGLWALDPHTGRMLWRVPIPEGGITAPVAVAGALMVGTTQYGLFLLSPLDGKPIDGFDLGTGFSQTPAAYGNRAFVLTNAGTLLGVQVDPPVVLKRDAKK
jgi:outer membrane protein assembly factor BamB